jgi:hypothetical protein
MIPKFLIQGWAHKIFIIFGTIPVKKGMIRDCL